MSVRAKFQVNTISAPRQATRFHGNGKTTQEDVIDISLYPVTTGSDENKEFYANTPGGSIQLQTVNLEAAKQFEQGKEYYIDFTPAE